MVLSLFGRRTARSEMLAAILRGKLSREQENLEDLLTSCVFGLFQYLPAGSGLLPFLQLAKYPDGRNLLDVCIPTAIVRYQFWPWLTEEDCVGAEPDLLVDFTDGRGDKFILLVEAKLWSDKSSVADEGRVPSDQLAKEWDNLVRLCNRSNARPLMLYLTADTRIPDQSLQESSMEFSQKRPELAIHAPFSCAWVSWRHVVPALLGRDGVIEADLMALMRRLGLTFFEGISTITPTTTQWWFHAVFDLKVPSVQRSHWTFAK